MISLLAKQQLMQAARMFHAKGTPEEMEQYTSGAPRYQQTHEHLRWRQAWEQKLDWAQWEEFLKRFKRAFPGPSAGGFTRPWQSSCHYCIAYFTEVRAEQGLVTSRLVAAVSILAPVYLTYVTVTPGDSTGRAPEPQLLLEPSKEMQPHARRLSSLLEESLPDHHPFPLELADITLPDIYITYMLELRTPTLLDALFDERSRLSSLP